MIACNFVGLHVTPLLGRAHPCALAVDSGFGFLEGMMPPLYRQLGSIFRWVGAFCIRKAYYLVILSNMGGYLTISLLPFYLALPIMTQFCDWLHPSWGSLSNSINKYRHQSLCLTYVFLPKSAAKSYYLWSSPVISGCSSRCPWEKLQLPIFHPREALLVGH